MASSSSCSSKKPMRRLSFFFFLAVVVVAFLLLIDVADATFDKSTKQTIRDAKKAKKAAIKQARLDMKEARKEARWQKKVAKHTGKTSSPTALPEQFIIEGKPSKSTQPLYGEVGGPNNKKGFAKQMAVFNGTGEDPVVQSSVIGTPDDQLRRLHEEQDGGFSSDAGSKKEGEEEGASEKKEKRRLAPTPGVNFPGLTNAVNAPTAYVPPDIIGAVGPNHYVQMVNSGIAAYFKNGAVALSPRRTNSLFVGSGLSICETQNDGDPTVLYDRLNDRWIVSQFAVPGPYGQCIAVSTTGNPAGGYYRYWFQYSTTLFNDYPKMALWNDNLVFTFNVFDPNNFVGAAVMVIKRSDLIAGVASPKFVTFNPFNTASSLLPADVDGPLSAQPPTASPPKVMSVNNGALRLFNVNVDWNNMAAASISAPTLLTTAAYTTMCAGSRDCVPQGGTTTYKLDSLSSRLMNRLAYRKYATHDAMVVTHSVEVSSPTVRGGCRWYEVRNIASGTPVIFQQGTYAPDGAWRWMGTTCQDKVGNMGLAYTFSSPTVSPGIAYTGRLAGDAAGLMTQGETVAQAGTGYQTVNRWGDYASMNIDPTDDCTFWFTHEYSAATGWGQWATRIVSFKLPGCDTTPTPVYTLAPSVAPTKAPTSPTSQPSKTPTRQPSSQPTRRPTGRPTSPTRRPSLVPTSRPTRVPTKTPTRGPSNAPVVTPAGSCTNPDTVVAGNNAFSTTGTSPTPATVTSTCFGTPTAVRSIYNVRYFKFVPATTKGYVFSTCGTATFNTKIAIMTSACPSGAALQGTVRCADNTAGCSSSTFRTASVTLTAGLTYYIALGAGNSGGSGTGTLTIT